MAEAAAVTALGLTVTLVLSRPRLGRRLVIGPALAALAGVLVMFVAGHIGGADVEAAVAVLWRPLIAIASIMVMATAAEHLGVIDRLATTVMRASRGSVSRLYPLVFGLSAVTAAVLNNDSAVLVLTPLVVVMVRRLYPDRPGLLLPFAFAVFMAAGVAPLVTSNPMNLIVADFAGLDFNAYAVRMVPVALVGMLATYLVLHRLFRAQLIGAPPAADVHVPADQPDRWSPAASQGVLLIGTVLITYPVIAYFDGALWLVALAGAVTALGLCTYHRAADVRQVLSTGVAWQILILLAGLFTLAIGLRNSGVLDWLTGVYESGGTVVIGVVSAAGSALVNNHSMALTNILAIEATADPQVSAYLAALIGGDLGPRLLPIGSLAGLLWLAILERMSVRVPVRQFIWVGALVTAPSLAVSLAVLALVT